MDKNSGICISGGPLIVVGDGGVGDEGVRQRFHFVCFSSAIDMIDFSPFSFPS